MSGTVYLVQNKINGKVYVGLTENPKGVVGRYNGCRFPADSKRRTRRSRAIDSAFIKYGSENFIFQDLMTGLDHQAMDFWERYFIQLFGSMDPDIGYNRDAGGYEDKTPSTESKDRNRLAHLGKKQTAETIAKRVVHLKGKRPSDATIAAAVAFWKGRKKSANVIEAVRKAHIGRKQSLAEREKKRVAMLRLNRKLTEEQKAHLLKFTLGKKRSEEIRRRQSIAQTGRILKLKCSPRKRRWKGGRNIELWHHPVHGEVGATAYELARLFPELDKHSLSQVRCGYRDAHKDWRLSCYTGISL